MQKFPAINSFLNFIKDSRLFHFKNKSLNTLLICYRKKISVPFITNFLPKIFVYDY